MTLDIEGLNLERLLRAAAESGVVLLDVRRTDARTVRVRIGIAQRRALAALCGRYGWEMREVRAGVALCAARFLRRRAMLGAGLLLCVGLVYLSAQTVLAVRVEDAGENVAEVRRVLRDAGARPGRLKAALSTDELAAALALRVPGLAHAAVRFDGSTLVVSCRPAQTGQRVGAEGDARDVVALEAGVVTRISASSGTPQVSPGQAVRKGQVLIKGEERTLRGEITPVRAQGEVHARVFARGDARVSLTQIRTVETGEVRRRVRMESPWHSRLVRDAQPFDEQDVSVERQSIVGLYLPVWRRVETLARTVRLPQARAAADARSQAQGAAEKIAKLNCPQGVEILDKWVDYSMIDDEFVYATVVLEYERAISGRLAQP